MGKIDLTGGIYGRLEVIKEAVNSPRKGDRYWICFCECGKAKELRQTNLRSGNTKSCGCLSSEIHRDKHLTHGMSNTSIYKLWCAIIERCTSELCPAWNRYGGRGIKVCYRWLKFENFFEDMGYKPEGLSIERRDNNKGYCKDNCYWADRKIQARNRKTNRLEEYRGEIKSLAEWCEILNIPYFRTVKRLNRGWSTERAFNG